MRDNKMQFSMDFCGISRDDELVRSLEGVVLPGGGDFAPGEESYYANRQVFSRLTPEDIPQPKGKVYRG